MKLFSQYDRSDLEQDIIKMLNVTELLKEFVRQYIDGVKIMSEDEVANYLDGIARVHELQFERLWEGFELICKNKHFESLSAINSTPIIKPKKGSKK